MFVGRTNQGVVTLVKSLQDPVDPSQFFFRGVDPFGCLFLIACFWLHTGATEKWFTMAQMRQIPKEQLKNRNPHAKTQSRKGKTNGPQPRNSPG